MMTRKITEIKRHLNKPTERYECDLLRSEPGGTYDSGGTGQVAPRDAGLTACP